MFSFRLFFFVSGMALLLDFLQPKKSIARYTNNLIDEMASLGNRIADLVIENFENNNLKGRPYTKSNGVREWTVLAGIVAIHGDEEDCSLDLISITTGVKSLPDEIIRKHSNGKLLHDCHAEILALRAFNRFITFECLKDQSDYVEKVNDGFTLKSKIEFALYVSEPPCGDCSLELLHDDSDEEWVNVNDLPNGVIRGRSNYKLTGKVRTTPGRRDSPVTLSKSCSDKLCLAQKASILNCVTSSFVKPWLYLKYLVVPEDKYNKIAFNRCFRDRFVVEDAHYLKVLTTVKRHHWENKESAAPSNRSLIYLPHENLQESIVNYMKEGFYSKKIYIRPNGESKLSRYQLWKLAEPLIRTSTFTYLEFKESQETYQSHKAAGQEALGNWCKTTTDDFDI